MENSAILGYHFESTKTFQPDSSSGDSSSDGKLVHQQIVNQPLLGETKHQLILGASLNCIQINNEGGLYYHELNA